MFGGIFREVTRKLRDILEKEQKKHHAITLRRQGWTERAIAKELSLSKTTIHNYLVTSGLNISDHSIKMVTIIKRNMTIERQQFHTFNGLLENFETNIQLFRILKSWITLLKGYYMPLHPNSAGVRNG